MTVINGAFDHSDETTILVFPNGKRYTLVTCQTIDYENGGEAGEIRGQQPNPVTFTTGKLDPKYSFEIPRMEWQAIIVVAGEGWITRPINIIQSYRHAGLPLLKDTVRGARLPGGAVKSATGDPAMCTVAGKAELVLWNGLDPTKRTS